MSELLSARFLGMVKQLGKKLTISLIKSRKSDQPHIKGVVVVVLFVDQ